MGEGEGEGEGEGGARNVERRGTHRRKSDAHFETLKREEGSEVGG